MSTVELSLGASQDIARLAAGEGRIKVAMTAIEEELLSTNQVAALKYLVEKYESMMPPAANAVVELSTEQKLRAENRIQDDPKILAKLGYDLALPKIPQKLLEECALTSGTVVLKFSTTVLDYQEKLNQALGIGKENLRLGLDFLDDYTLETTNEEPTWINVPNSVRQDTLGLSKHSALDHIQGSQTCDPMHTVLMLGYHNLQTGQQMPGFKNKLTFTNKKNTLVGSLNGGISVIVSKHCEANGFEFAGLAPRL